MATGGSLMIKAERAERSKRSERNRSMFAMLITAFACIALLLGAWAWLRPRIEATRAHARLAALADVLPPTLYDNNPLTDRIAVRGPLLGTEQALPVLRARWHGKPAALVLQAIAPNGYAGPIRLRIGIRYDGSIIAVRVIEEHETPGLGDLIDRTKSNWIEQFGGHSLRNPADDKWKVRKDGGDFDQLAGATVTPRAVVEAVRKTLQYYAANREALFAKPSR